MTFQVMLPCVSITPFGVPVVPDVCGSMHTSSSPMTWSTGSSADSATRCS